MAIKYSRSKNTVCVNFTQAFIRKAEKDYREKRTNQDNGFLLYRRVI